MEHRSCRSIRKTGANVRWTPSRTLEYLAGSSGIGARIKRNRAPGLTAGSTVRAYFGHSRWGMWLRHPRSKRTSKSRPGTGPLTMSTTFHSRRPGMAGWAARARLIAAGAKSILTTRYPCSASHAPIHPSPHPMSRTLAPGGNHPVATASRTGAGIWAADAKEGVAPPALPGPPPPGANGPQGLSDEPPHPTLLTGGSGSLCPGRSSQNRLTRHLERARARRRSHRPSSTEDGNAGEDPAGPSVE